MPLRRYVGLRLSDDPEAVPTTDDIAEGELAINTASERIYARFAESVRDITDRYTRDEIDAMLGTAAALDAPESGDASSEQVVLGGDSRLSDARAPTAHTHPWGEVTDKPDEATRWPTFAEVTDRPAAYPPESHTHTLSDITDAGSAAAKDAESFDAAGSAQAAQDHAVQRSNHTGTQTLSTISDAGTAAAADASDFDPAGSAAQVEHDIRREIERRPDTLLMHFL